MSFIVLNNNDMKFIHRFYPDLKIDLENKLIYGNVKFVRMYNEIKISDSYQISIDYNFDFPTVKSLDNKIENLANHLKIPITNLHINPDKSFCLAIQPRMEECFTNGIFNWKEFFANCLEPFLYAQSYFYKFKKFPWGEYSHSHLGYIELFEENRISLNDIPEIYRQNIISLITRTDKKCICGSSKDFSKCHSKIYKSIRKIKKLISF